MWVFGRNHSRRAKSPGACPGPDSLENYTTLIIVNCHIELTVFIVANFQKFAGRLRVKAWLIFQNVRSVDLDYVEITFKSGPGQAPELLAQYPVRREWFRPKSQKMRIGSKRHYSNLLKRKDGR